MPQYITLTAVPRDFGGTASDDNEIRFGSAPPRPIPVSTRTITRVWKSLTRAVAIDSKPNRQADITSTLFRPMRSASLPPNMAPGSRPNVPALNAQPICATDNPNSRAMRGAATPTDCRASPSRSAQAKHRPSVMATPDRVAAPLDTPSPGELVPSAFIIGNPY